MDIGWKEEEESQEGLEPIVSPYLDRELQTVPPLLWDHVASSAMSHDIHKQGTHDGC